MSKEKVKVILAVDASSSMASTKQETIDAVENLINEHRNLKDKKVRIEIYTFDSSVKKTVPLTKLKEYTGAFASLYNPSGMTALYDGIGKAITENINDTEFTKTSLVILTDGQENSSQEFNKSSATALITKVQDELGWDVTYLGAKAADFESFTGSIGIKGGKAIAFDPSQHGTRSVSLNAATTMSMAYMSANDLKLKDNS
jgi:uncharacterized protein YegL